MIIGDNYGHWFPALISFLMRRMRADNHVAEEIAAQVLAELFERELNDPTKEINISYAFATARSRYIDRIRALGRRPEIRLTHSPSVQYDHTMMTQIREHLFRLNDNQRWIFVLQAEGYEDREIAMALDVTPQAVRTSRRRGRILLKSFEEAGRLACLVNDHGHSKPVVPTRQ